MKIAMLGDIALIGHWNIKVENWRPKLLELKKILSKYDFVIANLESPLTDRKKSYIAKSMHLRSDKENVAILQYLGVSAVSLANNHILDFGESGLKDTIETLDKAGIDWYGINDKCLNLCKKNEKICISGFCCYSTNLITKIGKYRINLLSEKNVLKQLEQDELNNEYSIVSLHWGIEHVHFPAIEHIRLAEKMLSYKGCTIHGHHPHVLQGIYECKNGIATYSLGNCLFDDAVSLNKKIVVKQLKENKEFIFIGVNIVNNQMLNFYCRGFAEQTTGITENKEIMGKVERYSQMLKCIDNLDEYEKNRNDDFKKSVERKFKQDKFKWLMNRMSYYAIGARILRIKNEYFYRKIMRKSI